MKLITVINRKRKNHSYNDVVVEMKCDKYKDVLEVGKLRLPWRECPVFEHLHLKRCYKCCGFSHKSNECKQAQICSRCAGPHKFSDCQNDTVCCVNCKQSNEHFRTKLSVNHHAFSKDCPINKRRLASLVNKIEYNAPE